MVTFSTFWHLGNWHTNGSRRFTLHVGVFGIYAGNLEAVRAAYNRNKSASLVTAYRIEVVLYFFPDCMLFVWPQMSMNQYVVLS